MLNIPTIYVYMCFTICAARQKSMEEEKKEHVEKAGDLLKWVSNLSKTLNKEGGEKAEKTDLPKQQISLEEMSAKKEQIAEALQTTQAFLAKHSDKMTAEERGEMEKQVKSLQESYSLLSSEALKQLQEAQCLDDEKMEEKVNKVIAGVIDQTTGEVHSVFQSILKGFIDYDTGIRLLENQLILTGIISPELGICYDLEEAKACALIDEQTQLQLQELNSAKKLISESTLSDLPVISALEEGLISEPLAIKILENQLSSGHLILPSTGEHLTLQNAFQRNLISPTLYAKLLERQDTCKDLIDPNCAEKISLEQMLHRGMIHEETGLRLLPVKPQEKGRIALRCGRKITILRAAHEGLIDRETMFRLLGAQIISGGIIDPESGKRMTVEEAVSQGIIGQDAACGILTHQVQTGGILCPNSGQRLTVDEAIQCNLISSTSALLVLEAQKGFVGLIWPDTGEIFPISTSLHQEMITNELAFKILSDRQKIAALYIPETCEVLSLDRAAQSGLIDINTVSVLNSVTLPDKMPSVEELESSCKNAAKWLSAYELLPSLFHDCEKGHEDSGTEDPVCRNSDQAKKLFISYLMVNSYMDANTGGRLLLYDGQLQEAINMFLEVDSSACSTDVSETDFSSKYVSRKGINLKSFGNVHFSNITSKIQGDPSGAEDTFDDKKLIQREDLGNYTCSQRKDVCRPDVCSDSGTEQSQFTLEMLLTKPTEHRNVESNTQNFRNRNALESLLEDSEWTPLEVYKHNDQKANSGSIEGVLPNDTNPNLMSDTEKEERVMTDDLVKEKYGKTVYNFLSVNDSSDDEIWRDLEKTCTKYEPHILQADSYRMALNNIEKDDVQGSLCSSFSADTEYGLPEESDSQCGDTQFEGNGYSEQPLLNFGDVHNRPSLESCPDRHGRQSLDGCTDFQSKLCLEDSGEINWGPLLESSTITHDGPPEGVSNSAAQSLSVEESNLVFDRLLLGDSSSDSSVEGSDSIPQFESSCLLHERGEADSEEDSSQFDDDDDAYETPQVDDDDSDVYGTPQFDDSDSYDSRQDDDDFGTLQFGDDDTPEPIVPLGFLEERGGMIALREENGSYQELPTNAEENFHYSRDRNQTALTGSVNIASARVETLERDPEDEKGRTKDSEDEQKLPITVGSEERREGCSTSLLKRHETKIQRDRNEGDEMKAESDCYEYELEGTQEEEDYDYDYLDYDSYDDSDSESDSEEEMDAFYSRNQCKNKDDQMLISVGDIENSEENNLNIDDYYCSLGHKTGDSLQFQSNHRNGELSLGKCETASDTYEEGCIDLTCTNKEERELKAENNHGTFIKSENLSEDTTKHIQSENTFDTKGISCKSEENKKTHFLDDIVSSDISATPFLITKQAASDDENAQTDLLHSMNKSCSTMPMLHLNHGHRQKEAVFAEEKTLDDMTSFKQLEASSSQKDSKFLTDMHYVSDDISSLCDQVHPVTDKKHGQIRRDFETLAENRANIIKECGVMELNKSPIHMESLGEIFDASTIRADTETVSNNEKINTGQTWPDIGSGESAELKSDFNISSSLKQCATSLKGENNSELDKTVSCCLKDIEQVKNGIQNEKEFLLKMEEVHSSEFNTDIFPTVSLKPVEIVMTEETFVCPSADTVLEDTSENKNSNDNEFTLMKAGALGSTGDAKNSGDEIEALPSGNHTHVTDLSSAILSSIEADWNNVAQKESEVLKNTEGEKFIVSETSSFENGFKKQLCMESLQKGTGPSKDFKVKKGFSQSPEMPDTVMEDLQNMLQRKLKLGHTYSKQEGETLCYSDTKILMQNLLRMVESTQLGSNMSSESQLKQTSNTVRAALMDTTPCTDTKSSDTLSLLWPDCRSPDLLRDILKQEFCNQKMNDPDKMKSEMGDEVKTPTANLMTSELTKICKMSSSTESTRKLEELISSLLMRSQGIATAHEGKGKVDGLCALFSTEQSEFGSEIPKEKTSADDTADAWKSDQEHEKTDSLSRGLTGTAYPAEALLDDNSTSMVDGEQECLKLREKMQEHLAVLQEVKRNLENQKPISSNLEILKEQLEQLESFESGLATFAIILKKDMKLTEEFLKFHHKDIPEEKLKELKISYDYLQEAFLVVCDTSSKRAKQIVSSVDSEMSKLAELHKQLLSKLQTFSDWLTEHNKIMNDFRVNTDDIEDMKQSLNLLKDVAERQQECKEKLQEICDMLTQTENRLIGQQESLVIADSKAELEQYQTKQEEIQKDMRTSAQTLAEIVKNTENFLKENGGKLSQEDKTVLEQKLNEAKTKCLLLSQKAEESKKELDKAMTTAIKQETEKVAAIEQLEESKNTIENLLDWLSNVDKEAEHGRKFKQAIEQNGTHFEEGDVKALGGEEDDVNGNLLEIQQDIETQVDGLVKSTEDNLNQQYQKVKAQHEKIISQQQAVIIATQSAQALLEKQGHYLSPEEKEKMQRNMKELKAQYEAALAESERKMKMTHSLREELEKFDTDYSEFETWLQQAEQELDNLEAGASDFSGIMVKLKRQKSFSEDVISHKGDLRYITISGQRVLDAARSCCKRDGVKVDKDGVDTSATYAEVQNKLDSASDRFKSLYTKCSILGNNLKDLADKYQHYEDASSGLLSGLQASEVAVNKQLSEPIAVDPKNLQRQLEETKVLQRQVSNHQIAVEKLKKAAEVLLDSRGELASDKEEIQKTLDDVVERYDNLSKSVNERNEKLQIMLTRSLSVQDGLDEMLDWMEGVEKSLEEQDQVPLNSAAIQDIISKSIMLEQDIAGRQSSINTMNEKVKKFMETADPSTASSLQAKMSELAGRFSAASKKHKEKLMKMEELKTKVELFEGLSEKLQSFLDEKNQALSETEAPRKDVSEVSQYMQEASVELTKHKKDLEVLQNLLEELSVHALPGDKALVLEKVNALSKKFREVEETVKEKEEDVTSCQKEIDTFELLVESLKKWIKETTERIPAAQPSLNTEELKKPLEDTLNLKDEWTLKATELQKMNSRGTLLCNLISAVTSPAKLRAVAKSGGTVLNGEGGAPGTQDFLKNKELTSVQQAMSDVNHSYEDLGVSLKKKIAELESMLSKMQNIQEESTSVMQWLQKMDKAASDWEAAPTDSEAVKAQVEQHKLFETELKQSENKVQELKDKVTELLEKNPNSPEAPKWRQVLDKIDSKWKELNQVTSERQQKLEESSNYLTQFQTAEAQLKHWLVEKELMVSVLGPLSIDPNMLNTQKQQVQILLKEFDTRKPQYEQLTMAGEGILKRPGEHPPSHEIVKEQLAAVAQKWDNLTGQLSNRCDRIDQAIVKSTEYQSLLRSLSVKLSALDSKLSSSLAVSTQPDAVKQQLEVAKEMKKEIEQEMKNINAAQVLCEELSTLVEEEYLKAELTRQLDGILKSFKDIEQKSDNHVQQLQSAYATSHQFQQMSKDFQAWLDRKKEELNKARPISAKLETLQSLIEEQNDFVKTLTSESSTYEKIVAEGESILQKTQGADKAALQAQIATLGSNWDEMDKKVKERQNKLTDCLEKALKYKQHVENLQPWIEKCQSNLSELKVSINPVEIENSVVQVRAWQTDLDKHHGIVELLNNSAESLLNASQTDKEIVEEETKVLNEKVSMVTEQLRKKRECLENMAQRLKEFQESSKETEKQLQSAKEHLEAHDSLGPQSFSNKHLTMMQAQQKTLQALKPQVDLVKKLAQELVVEASDSAGVSDLLLQAESLEKEYTAVNQQVEDRCSFLETKLQGIGHFQNSIREMFSQFAEFDDELDGMAPVGRDLVVLQSQRQDIQHFLKKLEDLIMNNENANKNCKMMLATEAEASPDLVGIKQDLEALNKQCNKLLDRAKAREEQVESTINRVEEFYSKLKEFSSLLGRAEEHEESQGPVGMETDTINQQLNTFKEVKHDEKVKGVFKEVNKCGNKKQSGKHWKNENRGIVASCVNPYNMGKPLSRPDCLRQNPPCVGKGEEDEDLNIEDCYVPQRSIYDTVRLNEQIDSGSKGSLSSRHFTDRTLPYSHRTLDISTLCSNGALTSSSAFELRSREAKKLDEKMIFDALKLNGDVIRTGGLPKTKSQTEKKEHRRSWRMFVPPNFSDYTNKSECSFSETGDLSDTARSDKRKWGTNSLTSEEDDSGLCSPPAEREEKQDTLLAGERMLAQTLSSAEDIQAAGQLSSLCREQQTPLLAGSSGFVRESCRLTSCDILPSGKVKRNNSQKCESDQEETGGKYSESFRGETLSHGSPLQADGGSISLCKNGVENGCDIREKIKTQVTTVEGGDVDDASPQLDGYCVNFDVNSSDMDLEKYEIFSDPEDLSIADTGSNEMTFSVQQLELDCTVNSPKAIPGRSESNVWTTGMQETLDTVCNGLLSNKVFQKEEIEPLQVKQQEVNWLGQGLIQSAAISTNTESLEHDLEDVNTRWKTLNKKVAQRAAQLQEALLHCGRFQDALESLLSWLIDTKELVANQKPPSAEFKVVKAQIQEQKLLQRLLDDRKPTVELIKREGEKIAESAEPADKVKILKQLSFLDSQWDALLTKAETRYFKFFHSFEKYRCSMWWMALEDDVLAHNKSLLQAISIGQSLKTMSSREDKDMVQEKLDTSQARYIEIQEKSNSRSELLQQAYCNAQIFGEEEVELMNWLNEVHDKLSKLSVQDWNTELLEKQHSELLELQEEILLRKQNVDLAIQNGLELLKQTAGDEVIIIQDKLEGIKVRYRDITKLSSDVSKTLEQALQLAGQLHSTHEELCTWLDKVEMELLSYETEIPKGEELSQAQERQKELKKEAKDNKALLDTLNEVGSAFLELVPWRAREGLDKMISEDNERYRLVSDTISQKVDEIDAAILRSQQFDQAADAELAWIADTEKKLMSLGGIRLEKDQTTAQLQVQKAFTMEILRHKDAIDELVKSGDKIMNTCTEEEKQTIKKKLKSLLQKYDTVCQMNSERNLQLERAQSLVNQFWETYEELWPWLTETEMIISQLPAPALEYETLKQQQEEHRQLRELIAEHKPHIDKMNKTGPQLLELSPGESFSIQEKYVAADALYSKIKEDVKKRALALDEAISQCTQFHDKIDPTLESLKRIVERLRQPPSISAEVEKIKEQISENKNVSVDLEKLQPVYETLKQRGEEMIARSEGADKDVSAKAVQDKLDQMVLIWQDIQTLTEEREAKLLDVMELAEKFWCDHMALVATIKDTQDFIRELEGPGVDPSVVKQQQEAAEAAKEEIDGLQEELETVLNSAWDALNKTWKERVDKLAEAMQAAVQYQDGLQAIFDWVDIAGIKLASMSPVGTDLETVKQQTEELKQFKTEAYQQQIEMERLNHQAELLLKKVTQESDKHTVQDPLTELKQLWHSLEEKIINRQHKLEGALLALGQFQHALDELLTWLTHTEDLLNEQKPVGGDPKAIEIELAKHHVLQNDVLAHQSTVEAVKKAGSDLIESSAVEEASNLRSKLELLNQRWQNVLEKTEQRKQQLDSALIQAQGFHGEVEDMQQWLTDTERQLLASKPVGGLPETAREQLNTHMELCSAFEAKEETYKCLMQKGQQMLARCPESAETNVEQDINNLKEKWESVQTKLGERKTKLEEALNLAMEFHNSLQDFINWLTQAEQTLTAASRPSLILDTVLFQIDEHKVFATEVNSHRDQIIELDKTGTHLKYFSQKQDVVLIKNLLISVQSRWEKVVQRLVERGRALDDARKRAKQFCEAWHKLMEWLEESEKSLDSDLEIANDPDKIKMQLAQHKEFQKSLGAKHSVYDTTNRTGRSLKEKTTLADDNLKLDDMLSELRDKWDTICGKSVERQNKLEEALLFSGQFTDALQALIDWLYKIEPQLAEDQPVHGDIDLVMNLIDNHKVFQKELGKRTSSVQALKRSARELIEGSRDDSSWVKVQMQELSTRWETVCALSVSKQTRLEQALRQAEEFHSVVHVLLEWLAEAEQTLRFHGVLPDDEEALRTLIDQHREFMKKLEEKKAELNKATGMGEAILAICHPDSITTIKHWITIIRARFEEVLAWAKQHQQRLAGALAGLIANQELLEDLLSWLQWAETTLTEKDKEVIPQEIEEVKALIAEHQTFMEEMTRKQPDVDKVTKTYKRKALEPTPVQSHIPVLDKGRAGRKRSPTPGLYPSAAQAQIETKNPRVNLLVSKWQQVWLLALERRRKLNDALDRLEELREFANFDFDIWRKKYMRWMNHKKSRVMDFFRRIDKDQDGKITRQEFIDGILSSKFPTSRLEMSAVADIFDRDGDGYIDYYEFVAALHPNKDAYKPLTDADKIEDEVTRQVAKCKCAKRFQVEQIGDNKYRFGDSQQLRLVRILRSTVMVRVGGGWMALDEFLVKNDPCRAKGRTNVELREKFILADGASQSMAAFRPRGRRSRPSSRAASPNRSTSLSSQAGQAAAPQAVATSTPKGTPIQGSKLRQPGYLSGKGFHSGEDSGILSTAATRVRAQFAETRRTPSRPGSRAGSKAGSRSSSCRGSDASDFDISEIQSVCSDMSETVPATSRPTPRAGSRPGSAKPSKIPTPQRRPAASKLDKSLKR
ncbi:UNVERIFIED_CONTAM: hypothetical protein H355_004747 [Colinus virginianus]|nr:hypothetical protein H355_004747 [Colinus virginianus]